jgi:hypothetical protein
MHLFNEINDREKIAEEKNILVKYCQYVEPLVDREDRLTMGCTRLLN